MQHRILIRILEEGLVKMTTAQEKLEQSSRSFNSAYGKVISLTAQLNVDFDEKSEYAEERAQSLNALAQSSRPCVFWICWENDNTRNLHALVQEIREKMKKIQKFHEEMKDTLSKANTDIDNAKNKLKEEIRAIGDLKVKAQSTKENLQDVEDINELDDVLTNIVSESVNKLLKECENYRSRHASIKNK